MTQATILTRRAKLWAMAAAVPFLLSLALLGIALSSGLAVTFAIAWPIIQIFGYYGALRFAKGQIDHRLFHTQVVLHWLVLVLLIAMIARGA